MAPRCARRQSGRKAAVATVPSKQFDIPYFAHMQLDPAHFTGVIGAPIGGPPYQIQPYGGGAANAEGQNDWEADSNNAGSEDMDEDFVQLPPKTKRKTVYKKLKVEGGRPPVAKKVTADLDSDDELIVRMKNAKYLEKDIAERLAQEGRVNYHPKTIGTRWARIKRVLQRVQDQMLDEELTDWHEGDDDVLRRAVEKADADVAKAKKDADEKRWRIVADQMKMLKPVLNFSQNACRERFEALKTGTAKPVPESIRNPDEHVLARIQSRVDKEQRIREDTQTNAPNADNIEGNAWTSRMRTYY